MVKLLQVSILNQALLATIPSFVVTTEEDIFKKITNEEHLTTAKLFNIFEVTRFKGK